MTHPRARVREKRKNSEFSKFYIERLAPPPFTVILVIYAGFAVMLLSYPSLVLGCAIPI